jgi:NhaP-type Na+/H+ or K+/H+ antiporter
MTYYIIIALCVIVIFSYIFELSAKYTKIPGVILLIITGMFINSLTENFNIKIPDLSGLLPLMGTIGLILIVLEGSLDLTIDSSKKKLIAKSITASIILFAVFVTILTLVLVYAYQFSVKQSLINSIPLGIISSAVAIPSAIGLNKPDKEFVIYESSISDIIGILAFDFILVNNTSIARGLLGFVFEIAATIVLSVVFSSALAYILHKISHHVKYIIITTAIILVYSLAKLIHLPSLLVVLIFGLVMNNNHLFRNKFSSKWIDFQSFDHELISFKHITGEFTFIIRSFFFIMFGFYTNFIDVLNLDGLIFATLVTIAIFILRGIFFKTVIKTPLNPLLFFAPRGLITILLFMSIPKDLLLPSMNKGLITQIIFLTILMMTFGNVFLSKVGIDLDKKFQKV